MKWQTFSIVVLLAASAEAADWPSFRGPQGNGHTDAQNIPTKWSSDENVAWKIELPGQCNGSPIVIRDRVLLTSATDDGRERRLHCLATKDGANIWTKSVSFDRKMPTHKTNLFGGTTPASDGKLVVVWHGSAGLFCYDMDGNEKWHRNYGDFRHQWGYGTSPVIHDGRVILHSGPGQKVFVAALDLSTGNELWKTDEAVENDGERNDANKYMGSWSTPVIVKRKDAVLAVCSMATRTNAYDVSNGKIVWTCDGLRGPRGDLAYASPVIAGNICVAMGGFKGPAYGVRMTGSGNLAADRLWREEDNPQRIGSGVFVDGYVYMSNAGPNLIQCINPESGEIVWQERGAGGAYWGSIVAAEGLLYATDQNGSTLVFKPSPEGLLRVSLNRLNDAGNSTPAVTDGAIYIRTFRHLYRIGA